jgi:hypothetical protein
MLNSRSILLSDSQLRKFSRIGIRARTGKLENLIIVAGRNKVARRPCLLIRLRSTPCLEPARTTSQVGGPKPTRFILFGRVRLRRALTVSSARAGHDLGQLPFTAAQANPPRPSHFDNLRSDTLIIHLRPTLINLDLPSIRECGRPRPQRQQPTRLPGTNPNPRDFPSLPITPHSALRIGPAVTADHPIPAPARPVDQTTTQGPPISGLGFAFWTFFGAWSLVIGNSRRGGGRAQAPLSPVLVTGRGQLPR